MQGLSERQYAERVGLCRDAIQKAKAAGRLVLYADGSINAEASDARRAEMTAKRGEVQRTLIGPPPAAVHDYPDLKI